VRTPAPPPEPPWWPECSISVEVYSSNIVEVKGSWTFAKLKAKIQDKEGISMDVQCFRWGEDVLEDEATLSDWDGKMVYLQVLEDEEEKKDKKEVNQADL
jgi:hypothetical protein